MFAAVNLTDLNNLSFERLRGILRQVYIYNANKQNFNGYTNLIEWILELGDCFDNQDDRDIFKKYLRKIILDLSRNICDFLTNYIEECLEEICKGTVTDEILQWISMKPCLDMSADCFYTALRNRKEIFMLFNTETNFKEFSKEKLREHTEYIKYCIPFFKDHYVINLEMIQEVKKCTHSLIYACSNAIQYYESDNDVKEILNDCFEDFPSSHSVSDIIYDIDLYEFLGMDNDENDYFEYVYSI